MDNYDNNMSRIAEIYESLGREEVTPRTLPLLQMKAQLAPWNSAELNTPRKHNSRRLPKAESTVRSRTQKERGKQKEKETPLKECVKRTSYCFEREDGVSRELLVSQRLLDSRRYSSDHHNQPYSDRPSVSGAVGERRMKIKSYNEQELLRKHATLDKMTTLYDFHDRACYQTLAGLQGWQGLQGRQRNAVETRSRNIQMIRHISQRRVTP